MILFLDFDGVLHPFHRPLGTFVLLSYFEDVLRDFPAVNIVISSTWREEYSLPQLQKFFSEDIARRIIDVTPSWQDLNIIMFVKQKFWLGNVRQNVNKNPG